MSTIFGIRIDTMSKRDARERLAGFFVDGKQHLVVTPNPEILLAGKKDRGLREALNAADMSMPDGFGLLLVLKLFGARAERFTGVEISEDVVRLAQSKKEIIYFLGDEKGSAEKAAVKFPQANIIAEAGPDFKKNSDEVISFSKDLIGRINAIKPAVVLAAFGHPNQEKWLHEYLPKMPSVKIAIGVGGTFDFWSGVAHRAPSFMRSLGLEWLWRLFSEPKRWKRIFNAVVMFPVEVMIERLRRMKNLDKT